MLDAADYKAKIANQNAMKGNVIKVNQKILDTAEYKGKLNRDNVKDIISVDVSDSTRGYLYINSMGFLHLTSYNTLTGY